MQRLLVLVLSLTLAVAGFAANLTVVVNGKTVQVPMVEVNGKVFVDVAALAKLLNGAAYDAAAKKLVIGATTGTTGTPQLAGDNGELAKVYTMRKSDPLYFALLKAEFSVAPIRIGDKVHSASADGKLLVLHFTVQNPNTTDRLVRWDSLRFMVVDALNVNHPCRATWGDALTRQDVAVLLKPAQKLEMYTVIPVPAAGEIPKLMVQSNRDDDGPVLRYDLRGKVKPLSAPVADPADATGATARSEVPAQLNTSYGLQTLNVTVEKTELITTALDIAPPANGGRFLVATLLVKNLLPRESRLRWDTMRVTLLSTDGEKLRYISMLLATANRRFDQMLDADGEARVRIYCEVPKDATPQTLAISQGDSRAYVFPMAN